MVIPIYNEVDSLESLVREVTAAAQDLRDDWELVLVDDGSDDGSASWLKANNFPNVRVIRFRENRGQSTALLAGMRASRFDVVATLDGDLQNDPKDLRLLLDHLEHADMVCGHRQNRQDTPWRRFVSRRANEIRSSLTGDGVSDTGCSLKVFTGEVADKISFYHGAHRFMPALAQLEGFRVTEVPVSHRPRVAGTTKYGNWNRLRATIPDLVGFLWMKSRYSTYEAEEL